MYFRHLAAVTLAYLCSPALALAQTAKQATRSVDAPVVQGINTAGTVRACNLANLEALLNIAANGIELLGICVGSYVLLRALRPLSIRQRNVLIFKGVSIIGFALFIPQMVSWGVSAARDANLFL